MDHHLSCRGTYSKGVTEVLKTKEDKRAYYKQRKLIPNFNNLFIARNENHKPEQASREGLDSLCEEIKSLGTFEDSLPEQKSNSFRKHLTVNNSVTNSSVGVGHSSANDTFDKLVFVGRPRVPQASQVAACPSSSGSSFDCSDVLFKSLLSSVPILDSNRGKGTGLISVPEAIEKHKKEADVKQHMSHLPDSVDQHSNETKFKSRPSEKQQQMSPVLFSSDDSYGIGDFRNETGEGPEGQQSCKIGQVTGGLRGRKDVQTRKGKKSTNKVDDVGVCTPLVVSCKDTVEGTCFSAATTEKDVKELIAFPAKFRSRVPVVRLTQIDVQKNNFQLGQFSEPADDLSPSVPNKLENSSRILFSPSDYLTTDKKSPVGQKRASRTSQISVGSKHSGKSSVKSDICTSTPATASRHKTVSRSGGHWSLHASPSLENALSPVPRDDSLITVDTSSVFESPMSFKENSLVSSNKVKVHPSLGSKYESCLSSHNFEVSKPLAPSRELIKDSSGSKRGNPSSGSYYNSSKEITNGPFKGVFIPAYDPKGTSNNKLSPLQKDHDADSISRATLPVKTSRDIVEISPVLVNIIRRKKCVKKTLKRLQSSRDTSLVEKSGLIMQEIKVFSTPGQNLILPSRTKQHKSKCEWYPIHKRIDQESFTDSNDILKESQENNQGAILTEYDAKGSELDEESVILTRKSRLAYKSRNHISDLQQSPALLKRRTSKRVFKRKCKSPFDNVASSQESSSCMSKLSTDNEESPVLTSRARWTNHDRSWSFAADCSPVLTRRRTSKRLLKRTVPCDNVANVGDELQTLPVQTRRSVRLLLKSSKVLADDDEKLQGLSVQTRRTARQFSRQSNMKNSTNESEELSIMEISKLSGRSIKAGFSCTRASATSDSIISESCFAATFKKRRKRKVGNSVCYKANYSSSSARSCQGCSVIEEKESLLPNCEFLKTEGTVGFKGEVHKQESDAFKKLDCKPGESSANEKQESLKSQNISKEHYCKKCNSFESTQESANKDDTVKGKPVKLLQSVQDLSSSLEIENRVESLPFPSLIPVKPGKGWIRSLSNMAFAQTSFTADGTFDAIRRQTVHRISTGQRKISNLRMSVIPPEISSRIQHMGAHPIEEAHSRSLHQISFCSDHDRQQDYQLPSNPGEYVLQLCDQQKPLPLTECFTETRLACCKKIGEGVYGEVFMTRPNPKNMDGATVLKIMPIEGSFPVNGEPQKKFEEILSEIIISTELSNLQKLHRKENWTENFVHVLKSWCVQGSYHEDLLQLWDVFHEEKGSENDRPDIFPDSQLYIVLEFGHGGQDLESFVFNSARNALAVFLQIAYSLAVAEEELKFEHRDLHWGNVLVAQTQVASIQFKLSGGSYSLQTHGLKATVIDFTLSRMNAPQCVVYNNLAEDPALFTAEGDYQFEIYRQMKKANKNEWEKFTPYTNILWLHYILDKMTSECYFKNVKTKIHKSYHAQLIKMKNEMLNYESATDFVLRREVDVR